MINEIIEIGKRTVIDLGIHGLHPDLVKAVGRMRFRSSYGQNLLQHSKEVAKLCGIMASELGLNPKLAKRAGLLHDIGKVPEEETEIPHALLGMQWAEKFGEHTDVCNAIGAHHDEIEMSCLISPIIQVCDAMSGARPGARRQVLDSYIERLKNLEDIALDFNGVEKAYAIQAGRELRVMVESENKVLINTCINMILKKIYYLRTNFFSDYGFFKRNLNSLCANLRDDFNLKNIMKNQDTKKVTKWIKDTKCKCSFECALAANIVWNKSMYPKLAVASIRNIGRAEKYT